MNLGELKKSLTRFPPDMDDVEILVNYVDDMGNVDADCLAFVGVADFREQGTAALLLGTWKAADIMQKRNPEKFPSNYLNRPNIKPKNTNEES